MENRTRFGWVRVGNDRRIEEGSFRARQDRRRDDHPFGRIAIAEVGVVRLTGKGVEAKLVVRDHEARLTAIAVDFLRPDISRAVILKCAVILRATLEKVLRPLRTRGKALELERRQAIVHIDELIRHSVEQTLTERCASYAQAPAVTFVGNIGKIAVRAHHAAVRPDEELERITRNRGDGMLVGVHATGMIRVAVLG